MRASLVAQLIKKMPAMGYLGSIPGLGRSPGEGKGYPLQYSGLKNSMECVVHRVAKSRTRLSNFQHISNIVYRCHHAVHWVFLIAQLVKNPPAMRQTLAPFLSGEDLLEKG